MSTRPSSVALDRAVVVTRAVIGTGRSTETRPAPRRAVAGRVMAVLAVLGLGLLVLANRADLAASGHALRTAGRPWLLAALAFASVWSFAHASMHAGAQRSTGLPASSRHLWLVSSAAMFVNHVAKSLGVAGLMVFLGDGRRRGLARGRVVAAYLLVTVAAELTFAATLVVAVVVLAVDRHLPRTELIAAAAFGLYLIVRLGVIAAAFRSRTALRRLWALPQRMRRGRRRSEIEALSATAGADELYDSVQVLRSHRRALAPTAAHALAIQALGVGILWSSLQAVHVHVGLLAVVAAYVASVLFSFVGFLPGGLGLVELSMVRVLTSFGAPKVPAVAAVVVYRLLDLWLPVLVGAIAARRLRRGGVSSAVPVPVAA